MGRDEPSGDKKSAGFDAESSKYREQFGAVIDDAIERRISFDEFMERIAKIIAVAYLIALLMGAGLSSQTELTLDEFMRLNGMIAIAIASARNFAEQIYGGQYDDEGGRDRAHGRLGLWITALLAVFSLGQSLDRADPFLRWDWSPEKDHCEDCVRLNGQVHRASEWRTSGWFPQSYDLECHGFNCGCQWNKTFGPSRGEF